MTQLQQVLKLDVRYPLIQAPMAGAQDSKLALAVSSAGAIGSLPGAMLSPEKLRMELEKIHSATDKPINFNFFCHQQPVPDPDREAAWRELLSPYYSELGIVEADIPTGPARAPFSAEIAQTLEPFRPQLVSFHFGLPEPELLQRVKSWGSKILVSATTVAEARWLQQQGVDAIIAQGIEAGGHRGMFLNTDLAQQPTTKQLVTELVAESTLPIIAAGGIANAEQIKDFMKLGAAGVQIGTAYLCSHEALTSPVHKALLLEGSRETAITNLFTGRPARGMINRLVQELGPMNACAPHFPLAAHAIAPLRKKSLALGIADFQSLWCGTDPSGCKDESAIEITQSLTRAFL